MGIFFVTDRADAHIDRFFSLFLEISPSAKLIRVTYEDSDLPTAVIGESQFKSWASISEALSGSVSLVVSGPLDSVSSNLLVDGSAHVCISFASDVMLGLSNSEDVASRLEQLIPSAACVVTDNYATENALIAFGFTPEQILRIPWGPENDQETGFSSREALGWPESSKIVLYPRSLEPLYDPEVFLQGLSEVVQTHPKLIAVVIEAGSLVNLVKSRIQELGLEKNVIWHGLQTPDVFRSMLCCADLVVVTPRTDGTSVTVLEAMEAGIPVVTSQTPGSAEWIMDGITGWTFPVGNANKLGSAIARALDVDKHQRQIILARAKRLVTSRAGWQASAKTLADRLKTHISEAGHQGP